MILQVLLPAFSFLAAALVCGQQSLPPGTITAANSEPYMFRTTTREVLIDVVATDKRNHPVRDLSAHELEIVEIKDGGTSSPVSIASFQGVDAALDRSPVAAKSGGFRVSIGGDCIRQATFHYEVSFHPDDDGWKSGYHAIAVRTTRRDVKLAYHDRYYIGEKDLSRPGPPAAGLQDVLLEAACYHPGTQPSIRLDARFVSSGLKGVLRYFVTVDPDSLAFVSVSVDHRRVELDYGACAFDKQGRPLRYFASAADRMLTSSEYAQAVVHGFPNLLELPRIDGMALIRVVVRDRTTGNVGSIRLSDIPSDSAPQMASMDSENVVERVALQQMDVRANYLPSDPGPYVHDVHERALYIQPPPGPIGSFGSIVHRPDSFCGDVYDLANGTTRLPNFWNLSSIGSLYTTALDVPHQIFENTGGIPGITRGTAWLGIDYHAQFWVSSPGKYAFRLLVDDGANLFIDDKKVIDMDGVNSGRMASGEIELSAGAHSMHVPYIQGPPNAVGLVLAVKPPGQRDFQIFDLRSFSAPQRKEE